MSDISRNLWILDVGHGNSTVLRDERGTVVIDAGPGSALVDFLEQQGILRIDVILISHADTDHIKGVTALVTSEKFEIGRVRLNPDSTRRTKTFDDLIYALNNSYLNDKIDFNIGLTEYNSEEFDQGQVSIEVLAPSVALAAKGVGGQDSAKRNLRTNTLSVVIRLVQNGVPLALIPGDIDQIALDALQASGKPANAPVLVFPHHGGRPGEESPGKFAEQLCELVQPNTVVFSIGRRRFGRSERSNPSPQIVAAVRKRAQVRIACTQLSYNCADDLPKTSPSHLNIEFAQGREKRKCCAGTLAISLDETELLLTPSIEGHRAFIDANAPTALCILPLATVQLIGSVDETFVDEGA